MNENVLYTKHSDNVIPGLMKSEKMESVFSRWFKNRKISDKERSEFCTQLSVMLQARISIHRSLQALAEQSQNKRFKDVIQKIDKEIQKGNSFSKALASQHDVFDNLFIVTVEVGQESGRLAEVMSHLALYLEKMNTLKRKFLQALTYPFFVLSVACVAVLFLLVFIVPTFAGLFKSFQMDLPLVTTLVLGLSNMITKYGLYILGLLFVGLFISWKSLKLPFILKKVESYLFRIPFMGNILLKNHIARFCRTLGTLLQAQVSLLDALEVTIKLVTNQDLKADIKNIAKKVRQGSAIAEPVIESKFFPPMVGQMIAVGEETSDLDKMLLKVAEYYETEIDSKIETLSSVIEPIFILILGLIVASILIAMYLPMFDLVNAVGLGG